MADGDFKVKNGLQVGGKADIVYDTDLSLGSSGIVYAGTTEPSSPTTGDLWIDESPSLGAFSSYFRWQKVAAGSETSLSGLDDSGVSLQYVPGNEQVYINGVLQYRGTDYIATNGTTITGLVALASNDIIDVLSINETTTNQIVLYSSTAPGSPSTGELWVDTSQSVLDSSQLLDYTSSTGFRNVLINGDFKVWQRGTSFSISALSLSFTSDRWACSTPASAYTVSRQLTSDTSNLPNIQYCARVQRNSGQTSVNVAQFGQSVETLNSIPFAGKQVTLSFWARKGANYSATSSLLNAYISSGTGTDQNRVFGSYTGGSTVSSSVTLTSTWQRFYVTGNSIPSSATEIAIFFAFTPVGTAGAADYFEVTGVQLEANPIATAFEQRPYGLELSLCQRYYESGTYIEGYYWASTWGTSKAVNISWKVPKRATPDTSASSWSGAGWTGTWTMNNADQYKVVVANTATVNTGAFTTQGTYVADAEFY